MEKPINLHACRICLDTKCTSSVCMDDENGWLKLLEFSVGLVITQTDEPRILCAQCANQIQNYVKFKKQCHKSDLFWKSLVKVNVKCFAIDFLPEIEVKVENEDYLENKLDLDAENSQEIEYSEVKKVIENENIYVENLNVTDNGLNVRKFNGYETNSNICNDNSSDAIKIKGKDFEKDTIHHLELNKSCELEINVNPICPKCKKEYASKKWLRRHISMCDGKYHKKKESSQDFLCVQTNGFCPYSLKTQNLFIDLMSTHRSCQMVPTHFPKGICDYKGLDINATNQHLNEAHFSNNDLNCKLCDFSGVDLASLESHRFSHHSNDSKSILTCHKCSKRFGSVLSLEFHYRSVHLDKPGGICILCNNREFSVFKTWRRHDKSHKVTRFICDHCGRKYLYRYLIEAHLKDHSDVKNYVCDECGKRFKRMHGLKLHTETVHVKTEPLKCTHCNRIFKSSHTLESHMKRMFAEKSYQCPVCSKYFASEKILNNHTFWHSGERPHCCDICGSSYKAKSQLKLHMRKHTGEKPYQCLQCYKTFHGSSELKRHRSVHTGVRPVKCTNLYCDKTFYSKGARRTHCAKRHKIAAINYEK